VSFARLVLGIGACAMLACRPSNREVTTSWPDTTAAEWTVLTIHEQPVIAGSRLTVQTSPTGIGGYTGCNWYGMRSDSSRRGMEMTARACTRPAGLMEQERTFTSMLAKGAVAVRRSDTLIVRDSGGAAILTLLRRQPTGADAKQLPGTAWTLQRSTNPRIASNVTLRFTADSVSGFAGCRDFTGTWRATGDHLRFPYITMTRLECPHAARGVAEDELTTVLSETEYFSLSPAMLTLHTWGGDTVVFTRRAGPQQ
jgi:heat shock protein HslJ